MAKKTRIYEKAVATKSGSAWTIREINSGRIVDVVRGSDKSARTIERAADRYSRVIKGLAKR